MITLKDIRTDFLHKLSTKIINDNQIIVLADLNISGMLTTPRTQVTGILSGSSASAKRQMA